MELPPRAPDSPSLRDALTQVLKRRAVSQGSITLPAVPALVDEYVLTCLESFAALGVEFTPEQRSHLRTALKSELEIAFSASPRSSIQISYDSPVGSTVDYRVKAEWASLQHTYDTWVATREPPYFGTRPDARVWALAEEFPDASECPVLDVGAGTGRNALALARRGHRVDALELSREFASLLRTAAQEESLQVHVMQRDMFQPFLDLPRDYRLIVISEVASDFRSTSELQRMFELAWTCLSSGGRLVVNAFLARDGYVPDDAARQLGQQTYTSIFTRAEFEAAVSTLPLELIDDVSVHKYEREHLPPEAWPPTSWYENWVRGMDAFATNDAPPVEMRWLVYRKVEPRSATK